MLFFAPDLFTWKGGNGSWWINYNEWSWSALNKKANWEEDAYGRNCHAI